MVGVARIELATPCPPDKCATAALHTESFLRNALWRGNSHTALRNFRHQPLPTPYTSDFRKIGILTANMVKLQCRWMILRTPRTFQRGFELIPTPHLCYSSQRLLRLLTIHNGLTVPVIPVSPCLTPNFWVFTRHLPSIPRNLGAT